MTATILQRALVLARRYAPDHADALAAEIVALVDDTGLAPLVRGRLEIHTLHRRVLLDGRRVALHPREFQLLLELAHAAEPLLAEELRTRVLGRGFVTGTNAIEVHISRLRAKLGRDAVETIKGRGYRLGKAFR